MERQILHVDVNNAFLSWTAVEQLKRGEKLDIRTIPSVIGGDEQQRKGIVLAKSAVAKQFGIKTAEPIYFARKKCPSLKVYPSNFAIYRKYSDQLYELLLQYTDQIEKFSIDECFLDMTHDLKKDQTLLQVAEEIKKKVKEQLGFTVNIGVSTNKLLAKMASDFEKPDKIHTLYPSEISQKMWPLPVSELFMVGKRTLPKLEKWRIKTIKDLANYPKELLIKQFGKYGKKMWEYANGIDFSEVNNKPEKPKGIGNSITLPKDVGDKEKLQEVLVALSEQVAYRLRKEEMLANVISIQLKTKEFVSYSHQKKLSSPTDHTKQICDTAKELLQVLYRQGQQIRLIGLRVEDLTDKAQVQLSLFENTQNNNQKIDKVIDDLKKKYGYNAVTLAGKMKISEIIHFK